ncbi:MAG: hypothetical protein LIR25_00080, partial [bacterium]|nr:hypothetical protein [bacterium]
AQASASSAGASATAVAEAVAEVDVDSALITLMTNLLAIGVGSASQLIIFAPIMLLFSYTRKRNNKIIDTLIPVLAIVFILLVFLQGFFQIMHVLPISGKVNFKQIVDAADEMKVVLPQIMNMMAE